MNVTKNLVLLTLLMFLSFGGFAQIPDDIILSLKSGDGKKLASYFNENIEMVILEKDDVYSKSQAEQIVKDFFKNHPPSGFSILHQGGKEEAKYAIGKLKNGKGSYRVYFLLKTKGNKTYIHQLRIEKE